MTIRYQKKTAFWIQNNPSGIDHRMTYSPTFMKCYVTFITFGIIFCESKRSEFSMGKTAERLNKQLLFFIFD